MKVGWAITLVAGTLFSSAVGRAEDGDAELDALLGEEVVTSASKQAEEAVAAPALSRVISGADLRRFGLLTVQEAVDFLSVGLSTGGRETTGRRAELGARGVLLTGDRGSHFLVLINGHRMNEPYAGSMRLDRGAGVPLETIDRIEVITGPGSVLYGSNAMFGVINVITRRGADVEAGEVVVETEVPGSIRFGANGGTTLAPGVELSLGAEIYERWGPSFELDDQNLGIDPVSGRPTRVSPDDPETGIWGGTVNDADFQRAPSGVFRLDAGGLTVAGGALLMRHGMPYAGIDFDSDASFVERRGIWLDASFSGLATKNLELFARVYGDSYENELSAQVSKESSCFYSGVSECRYSQLQAARWGGSELRASLDWLADGRLETMVGAWGEVRFAGSKFDIQDARTEEHLSSSVGVVDRTDIALAGYLQQIWRATSYLDINLGARVDRDVRFDPVLSPRAALGITPWQNGRLRLSYAEAFRAPSYYETDLNASVQLAPESLKPERVRSAEASLEQRVGHHRLLVVGFLSRWQDMVELRALSDVEAQQAVLDGRLEFVAPQANYQEFRNSAEIESAGTSLAYDGELDGGLFWGGSFTTTVLRQENSDGRRSELPTAPRWSGNARVAYDLPKELPTVALAAHYLAQRALDQAFDGGFSPPPYAEPQLELKATVTGELTPISGLSYRVGARLRLSDETPYAVGPTRAPTALQPTLTSAPAGRFQALAGLSYRFGGEP